MTKQEYIDKDNALLQKIADLERERKALKEQLFLASPFKIGEKVEIWDASFGMYFVGFGFIVSIAVKDFDNCKYKYTVSKILKNGKPSKMTYKISDHTQLKKS